MLSGSIGSGPLGGEFSPFGATPVFESQQPGTAFGIPNFVQDDANFANLSAAKFTELENAASPVLSSSQKHSKMEQIAERFS